MPQQQHGMLRRGEGDNMLHGSSEFMLVLYPGEEDGKQHEAERIEKESEAIRRDSRTPRVVSSEFCKPDQPLGVAVDRSVKCFFNLSCVKSRLLVSLVFMFFLLVLCF